MVTEQLPDMPTRGLPNHGLVISGTGQLTDATGDFACLVLVFWPFTRPQVVQSATLPVHEMSSPRVGNPRVGVSASCPVTAEIDNF